jgi:hypothetical protein
VEVVVDTLVVEVVVLELAQVVVEDPSFLEEPMFHLLQILAWDL